MLYTTAGFLVVCLGGSFLFATEYCSRNYVNIMMKILKKISRLSFLITVAVILENMRYKLKIIMTISEDTVPFQD